MPPFVPDHLRHGRGHNGRENQTGDDGREVLREKFHRYRFL